MFLIIYFIISFYSNRPQIPRKNFYRKKNCVQFFLMTFCNFQKKYFKNLYSTEPLSKIPFIDIESRELAQMQLL